MREMPATLRWAVWLLTAEAAGLFAVVVFLIYSDLTAPVNTLRGAWAVTGYAAIMAAILALLGHSLSRLRRWARSPAIVLQMLLVPIGYYMISGGLSWLGVPVILIGLFGAGTLLAPGTRVALGLDHRRDQLH